MKPRVVYIAGQSFCGSTVFCALLGVHPEMEPVSELSTWSKLGLESWRVCACGKPSAQCEFWTAVRARWLDGQAAGTLPDYIGLQDKIETISYARPQLLGLPGRGGRDFDEYSRLTTSLFASLCAVSGKPIIVDSSKKPGRAAAISRMEGLDVTIIHLVRSGLSYLDSNIRRNNLSPDEPNFLWKVFRLGLRWSISNFAAERAVRVNRLGGVRVRYEDLLTDPAAALGAVGRAAGMDLGIVQEHVRQGRAISYHHMDSGSRHRRAGPAPLRSEPPVPVQFDPRVRIAFFAAAGLLSRRYGYI